MRAECSARVRIHSLRPSRTFLSPARRFAHAGNPPADTFMSWLPKHPSIRTCCLPVISALATLLAAAAVDPDQNWVRLRGLPNDRRARLVENLKRFDLLYSRPQQDALRDLDRRIHELSPEERAHHLVVLRRYHNWLNQLPETKQEELSARPAAERMVAVKKLVADYPLTNPATSQFVQMVDVGEFSPFELASLFQIWHTMAAERRRQVEHLAAIPKRHEVMYKVADARNIPHEIKPPDFDEVKTIERFEKFARFNRPAVLLNEVRKKPEATRSEVVREILRRQSINYYFHEFQPKPVTPERLAAFLAAFPPWLQSAFDAHPPDEAQRRLAIVYRLVFPHPSEMKPPARTSAPAPAASPALGQPLRSTRPGGKPSSKAGYSPF